MKPFLFFVLLGTVLNLQAQPGFQRYAVGDTAFCGIVFYVEELGQGRQRGLVCALKDQSTGIRWHNGNYMTTFASGDHLFAKGNADTIILIEGKDSLYAANVCARFQPSQACTGWYLPSKTELLLAYLVLYKTNKALRKLANFGSNPGGYWSSTEWRPDSTFSLPNTQMDQNAWVVDFYGPPGVFATTGRGGPGINDKANRRRVRAIREFRNF